MLFEASWGPTWWPGGAQDAPRTRPERAQDASGGAQEPTNFAEKRRSETKMARRAFWDRFCFDFWRFLMDFWWILEDLGMDFQ